MKDFHDAEFVTGMNNSSVLSFVGVGGGGDGWLLIALFPPIYGLVNAPS